MAREHRSGMAVAPEGMTSCMEKDCASEPVPGNPRIRILWLQPFTLPTLIQIPGSGIQGMWCVKRPEFFWG